MERKALNKEYNSDRRKKMTTDEKNRHKELRKLTNIGRIMRQDKVTEEKAREIFAGTKGKLPRHEVTIYLFYFSKR